jgi:peroxiredoxin
MARRHRPWSVIALLVAATGCARPAPSAVAIAEPVAPPPRPASEKPVELPDKSAKSEGAEPDEGIGDDSADRMSAWVGSRRGWLGVELEATGSNEAGVRVLRVVPRSPAEQVGLKSGDLIVRIDNENVGLPADVVRIVSSSPAGKRVSLMTKRAGQDRLVAATLGSFPEGDDLLRMTFIGQQAPPFEMLKTAQGNMSPSLGAHRGKVLVIEFWASWCVACRALLPHLNQWHSQYGARGLRVVGVTAESVERAALSANQLGMEYPILADESGQTTRTYHANALPTVFVVDRQGMVRDLMVGYDARRVAELDTLLGRLLAE